MNVQTDAAIIPEEEQNQTLLVFLSAVTLVSNIIHTEYLKKGGFRKREAEPEECS